MKIEERTTKFAVRIIRLHIAMLKCKTSTHRILGDQLLRSGTSIGACVREAISAESKSDFIHKMNIAQKEARETDYWLHILTESGLYPPDRLKDLQQEIRSIVAIISTIVIKTKRTAAAQKTEKNSQPRVTRNP